MVKTNEAQLRLLPPSVDGDEETAPVKRGHKREARAASRTAASAKRNARAERRSNAHHTLPTHEPRVGSVSPRKMAPALIVKHCNVLLAEIDRVAPQKAWDHEARANHLAQLFAAAERANEAQTVADRTKASA